MGSYQTTFELPDEWRGRRVLLEFDGIGPAATVWLNTWLGVGVGVGVGVGLGLGLANLLGCPARAARQRELDRAAESHAACHRGLSLLRSAESGLGGVGHCAVELDRG